MSSRKTVLTKGILTNERKHVYDVPYAPEMKQIFEISSIPDAVVISSDRRNIDDTIGDDIVNFLSPEDAIDLANHMILASNIATSYNANRVFNIDLSYNRPRNIIINNINNFRIRNYSDKIIFSTGINNSMREFIFRISDFLNLTNSIIEYALYHIDRRTVENTLDWCKKVLIEDIEKGNIEEIQIKYHNKKNPYDQEDKVSHIYNIYPKYKHGVENNNFNFNIVYDFGNIRKGTPEEIAKELFHINYFDDIYKANSEEEQELINKLRKLNPFIVSKYTPIKIKFINCRWIFEQDKNYMIYKLNKEKEKQKQRMVEFDPEEHKTRMEEVKKIVDSVPRKEDGTIDFESVISVFMQKEDE